VRTSNLAVENGFQQTVFLAYLTAGYLTQAAYRKKINKLPINIVSACLGVVFYSALDISDYIAVMAAHLMCDGLQSDWKEVVLPLYSTIPAYTLEKLRKTM